MKKEQSMWKDVTMAPSGYDNEKPIKNDASQLSSQREERNPHLDNDSVSGQRTHETCIL